MSRELKKQQTRERLYETALRLIRERGYDHVSIAEIAEQAGTAKGTFFNYFDSKIDVIAHWYQSTLVGEIDEMPMTFDEAISILIRSGIELLEAEPDLLGAKIAHESNSVAIMAADRETDARAKAVVKAAIEADPALPVDRKERSDALADLVMTVLTGAAHTWRYSGREGDMSAAMEQQISTLRDLIFRPPR